MKHLGTQGTGQDIATVNQLGGGAGLTMLTLSVPALAQGYAEVVVANAAITPASKVMAQLVGELDAENDLEEISDTSMGVFALPESGQIRFVLTGNSAFTGNFKIIYQLA